MDTSPRVRSSGMVKLKFSSRVIVPVVAKPPSWICPLGIAKAPP